MAEYIDRKEALDALLNGMVMTGYQSRAMDCVRFIPAADVAPIVHAHWEIKTEWIPLAWDTYPLDWDRYDGENHAEEEDYYACSRCGYDDGYWYPKDNYCPNCGARMDERSEEEK